MGCTGFMVAYISRRILESNYAKFGSERSKGLEVNRERTVRHCILYV